MRAQSKHPGDKVLKGFNRRICRMERVLRQKVLNAFHLESREKETAKAGRGRQGEIRRVDLRVDEVICSYANTCDEAFPTVAKIAKKAGLGESTVHEAKERLALVGALDWMHRAVEVENPEPGEPTVRQTSNLYRVNELPSRVLAAAEGWLRAAYAKALALTRTEAAKRLKAANARAVAAEAQTDARPRSPLYKRLLSESLAQPTGAAGALPDSS